MQCLQAPTCLRIKRLSNHQAQRLDEFHRGRYLCIPFPRQWEVPRVLHRAIHPVPSKRHAPVPQSRAEHVEDCTELEVVSSDICGVFSADGKVRQRVVQEEDSVVPQTALERR
jgi:hypothetical protein